MPWPQHPNSRGTLIPERFRGFPPDEQCSGAETGVVVGESVVICLVVPTILVVLGSALDVGLRAVDVNDLSFVVDTLDYARGKNHGLAEDPRPRCNDQVRTSGFSVCLVDFADVSIPR